MMKTAIIGATGYSGAELVRLLHRHPSVSIHSIHASSLLGSPLSGSYPHMQNLVEHNLAAVDVEKIASEVDIVFTATPTGVASVIAPQLIDLGVRVIDLSGDFRITDRAVFKKWYGKETAAESYLEQAVYGLTEWVDADLTQVNLLSNPGCFPTAALLGLLPLLKNRLVDEKSIIIDAKTGVSGAGKGLSAATHFAETNDNLKIYKVNEHQHTPEIEQILQRYNDGVGAVTFSPHLVPMTRGIMSTMYLTAKNPTSTKELYELYKTTYKNDYFVRIRETGQFPSTKEVYSSNFCDISLTYDERTNRITVVSVIDNLMKGASGQAVQNMNKMLGIDEKTGLDFLPIYP